VLSCAHVPLFEGAKARMMSFTHVFSKLTWQRDELDAIE
jgi:hypothetical protein